MTSSLSPWATIATAGPCSLPTGHGAADAPGEVPQDHCGPGWGLRQHPAWQACRALSMQPCAKGCLRCARITCYNGVSQTTASRICNSRTHPGLACPNLHGTGNCGTTCKSTAPFDLCKRLLVHSFRGPALKFRGHVWVHQNC